VSEVRDKAAERISVGVGWGAASPPAGSGSLLEERTLRGEDRN